MEYREFGKTGGVKVSVIGMGGTYYDPMWIFLSRLGGCIGRGRAR